VRRQDASAVDAVGSGGGGGGDFRVSGVQHNGVGLCCRVRLGCGALKRQHMNGVPGQYTASRDRHGGGSGHVAPLGTIKPDETLETLV
jgi:hypothetical protein